MCSFKQTHHNQITTTLVRDGVDSRSRRSNTSKLLPTRPSSRPLSTSSMRNTNIRYGEKLMMTSKRKRYALWTCILMNPSRPSQKIVCLKQPMIRFTLRRRRSCWSWEGLIRTSPKRSGARPWQSTSLVKEWNIYYFRDTGRKAWTPSWWKGSKNRTMLTQPSAAQNRSTTTSAIARNWMRQLSDICYTRASNKSDWPGLYQMSCSCSSWNTSQGRYSTPGAIDS